MADSTRIPQAWSRNLDFTQVFKGFRFKERERCYSSSCSKKAPWATVCRRSVGSRSGSRETDFHLPGERWAPGWVRETTRKGAGIVTVVGIYDAGAELSHNKDSQAGFMRKLPWEGD